MTAPPPEPGPANRGVPDTETRHATRQYITIDTDGRLALVTATVWPDGILRLIQQAVGGNIERVALRGQLDAWVNEEGRLAGWAPNPVGTAVCAALTDGAPPLMLPGTVVFLRNDGADTADLTPVQQQLIFDTWLAATRLRIAGHCDGPRR